MYDKIIMGFLASLMCLASILSRTLPTLALNSIQGGGARSTPQAPYCAEGSGLGDGYGEITAMGSQGRCWAAINGMACYSWSVTLSFNIYGGQVRGHARYRSDVVAVVRDDEGNLAYKVVGKGSYVLEFTGTYEGGPSGGFRSTKVTGVSYDTLEGKSYQGTITGSWEADVDYGKGVIAFSMLLKIEGGAKLQYPCTKGHGGACHIVLRFEPTPSVSEVRVYATPQVVGVSSDGDYEVALTAIALDSSGDPVSGRKLSFTLDCNVNAKLESSTAFTNRAGYAFNRFRIHVAKDSLPLTCTVTVGDELSGVSGSTQVSFREEALRIEIDEVSPGKLGSNGIWLVDAENVVIRGHVEAEDLTGVSLMIDGEGHGGTVALPSTAEVGPDGSFTIPASFMSPDYVYDITVMAVKEDGTACTATVKVHYLGEVELRIEEVEVPEMVEPGQPYAITVVVYYKVASDMELVVELLEEGGGVVESLSPSPAASMASEAARIPVGPGTEQGAEGRIPVSFSRQAPSELGTVEVRAHAQLNPIGADATSSLVTVMVSKADMGDRASLSVALPYPSETWRASELARVGRNRIAELREENIVDPEWLAEKGMGLRLTFTSVAEEGSVEVTDARIEIRQVEGRWPAQWISVDGCGEAGFGSSGECISMPLLVKPGEVVRWSTNVWRRGSAYPLPKAEGVYEIRVVYTISYEVSGSEVREEHYSNVVRIKLKSGLGRGGSTTYTTLWEEAHTELKPNTPTHLRLGGVGSRKSLSFGSPGVKSSAEIIVMQLKADEGPVAIVLDWTPSNADLDLHVVDPEGHVAGYELERGGARNTIPGANYSGYSAKPEYLELPELKDGVYVVTIYVMAAEGPVDATITLRAAGAHNQPPELLKHLVTPSSGSSSDSFEYVMLLRDPEGDKVEVWLEVYDYESGEWRRVGSAKTVEGAGLLTWNVTPFTGMRPGDSMYAFHYVDAQGNEGVWGPYKGPSIEVRGNEPPAMLGCSVSPEEGDMTTTYRYTVSLEDPDGDTVRVWLCIYNYESGNWSCLSEYRVVEGRGTATWSVEPFRDLSSNGSAKYGFCYDDGANRGQWGPYSGPRVEEASGCLVATAVYGSALAPPVQFLRQFRDEVVSRTFVGQSFMRAFSAWYYSWSPGAAMAIRAHPGLRPLVQALLYPLIYSLHVSTQVYWALCWNPELAVIVMGLVASALMGLAYIAPLALLLAALGRRPSRSMLKKLLAIWLISIAILLISVAAASRALTMLASIASVTLTMILAGLTLPALALAHRRRSSA